MTILYFPVAESLRSPLQDCLANRKMEARGARALAHGHMVGSLTPVLLSPPAFAESDSLVLCLSLRGPW